MPNVTLHLALADRLMERWEGDPRRAPVATDDPTIRNAFVQGSFGPDIGYFPGGDPFLSDLAHYVRAGDLTRALMRSAGNERERAFALGWLAHVLADQAIHPLVGEAAAELETGRRGGFLGISESLAAHVRVEVGLDAFVSERHPGLRDRRTRAVFDRRTVGFLGGAYLETYGLEIDPSLLLASHHAAVRMSNHALATIGALGSMLGPTGEAAPMSGGRWVFERTLEAVREGFGLEPMTLAFLSLVPPPEWLVHAVDEVVRAFPSRFRALLEGGLDELPNVNLDTGCVQGAPGSPCAERAHERLEALGGRTTVEAASRPASAPGSAPVRRRPVRYSGGAGRSW